MIIKTIPYFLEKIWGSNKLLNYGFKIDKNKKIGEAWVISAYDQKESLLENEKFKNMSLKTFFNKNNNIFNNLKQFPLLSKIITSDDYLSVQVHPDNEYQNKIDGSLGKAECWYIIECPENAKIIYGHNAKNFQELKNNIERNEWKKLLKEVNVKKGDFLYVPPGKIHAITPGMVIFELQQSSDVTYRLYDFDRIDELGNLRPLHLDSSLKVITVPDSKLEIININNGILIDNEYFTLYLINNLNDNNYYFDKTNWIQITVIAGNGKINETPFKIGESAILIAKDANKLFISGKMKILVSYSK